MNYYKKHLGDYAKKTGHLTPLEHGVYGLIIDGYYDREQGPTLIEATKWARARTEDEKSAVLAVLDEFFTIGEDGRYTQKRIEEELSAYQVKADANRVIALAREEAKRAAIEHAKSTKRAADVHHKDQEREPSHKPLATSHKPVKEQEPPIPPKGGSRTRKKSEAGSFKDYCKSCKVAKTLPIPEDCEVFNYAEKCGLSHEFLRLHWLEFRDRYSQEDAKKYKAWPTVFCKSVRGNWFKLWYANPDGTGYTLTTVGIQADKLHKGIEDD